MNAIPHDIRGWLARNRVRLLVVLLMMATYFNSYIVLSMLGDYYWSYSGRTGYVFGLSAPDRIIWHPRFAYWEPLRSRGNLSGYLYSPLIRLDRAWWHPTIEPQRVGRTGV
ncbi:MAG: hypothetical protein WBC44_11830 [Planctomycetaceae bacterium]